MCFDTESTRYEIRSCLVRGRCIFYSTKTKPFFHLARQTLYSHECFGATQWKLWLANNLRTGLFQFRASWSAKFLCTVCQRFCIKYRLSSSCVNTPGYEVSWSDHLRRYHRRWLQYLANTVNLAFRLPKMFKCCSSAFLLTHIVFWNKIDKTSKSKTNIFFRFLTCRPIVWVKLCYLMSALPFPAPRLYLLWDPFSEFGPHLSAPPFFLKYHSHISKYLLLTQLIAEWLGGLLFCSSTGVPSQDVLQYEL